MLTAARLVNAQREHARNGASAFGVSIDVVGGAGSTVAGAL